MGMIAVPWLEEAMEEKGITTNKELAERAGVSPATIGRALKWGELRSDTAEKVQSVFGSDTPIGPTVMGTDSFGIKKELIESEKAGNEYQVHQSEHVVQVRIYHPEKKDYLIFATFCYRDEDWRSKAVTVAKELNQKGVIEYDEA